MDWYWFYHRVRSPRHLRVWMLKYTSEGVTDLDVNFTTHPAPTLNISYTAYIPKQSSPLREVQNIDDSDTSDDSSSESIWSYKSISGLTASTDSLTRPVIPTYQAPGPPFPNPFTMSGTDGRDSLESLDDHADYQRPSNVSIPPGITKADRDNRGPAFSLRNASPVNSITQGQQSLPTERHRTPVVNGISSINGINGHHYTPIRRGSFSIPQLATSRHETGQRVDINDRRSFQEIPSSGDYPQASANTWGRYERRSRFIEHIDSMFDLDYEIFGHGGPPYHVNAQPNLFNMRPISPLDLNNAQRTEPTFRDETTRPTHDSSGLNPAAPLFTPNSPLTGTSRNNNGFSIVHLTGLAANSSNGGNMTNGTNGIVRLNDRANRHRGSMFRGGEIRNNDDSDDSKDDLDSDTAPAA